MKNAKFGFGTYRVNNKNEEHYKSMYKALLGGVRLIDTSSNYYHGQSEILTGQVISDLISENKISRADITLVTKGGYIQGEMYNEALEKKNSGVPFPDVVEYSGGLWHCIHPEFLKKQIDIQLNRLFPNTKGRYIDVYLLHNPEYFLGWAFNSNNVISDSDIKTEFYSRIWKAFEFLEDKVRSGEIRYYGISSNTFPLSSSKQDFVSLERVIDIAEKISPDNHFKYIEFPFNLIESEALFEKNQHSDTKTLLEYASKKKIKTLINRPLNCITNKGILRLADYLTDGYISDDLKKKIIYTANLEDEFRDEILPASDMETEDIRKIQKMIDIAVRLNEHWNKFGSIEYFNDVVENYFIPRLNFLIDYFSDSSVPANVENSFDNYVHCIRILLDNISDYYKTIANEKNSFINDVLNSMYAPEFRSLSLSQKALLLMRSVEGVDYVLTGARKEKYIEEILRVQNDLASDRIGNYSKILRRIKEQMVKENISKAEL